MRHNGGVAAWWLAAVGTWWVQAALATTGGTIEAPVFDTPRGHFEAPFTLTLAAPHSRQSIIYTTDGSLPSAQPPRGHRVEPGANGTARIELKIGETLSVRARTVSESGQESPVVTHSYLFPAQVLQQGKPSRPFKPWGHSGPDWEMDRDIVFHHDDASRVTTNDLTSIPALVLTLPFVELWGEGGIYLDGEGDSRDCAVELLNPAADTASPNAVPGLRADGSVQVTGGSSTQRWKTDKLSLRLKFPHGASFPFLAEAGTGADGEPVERFHTLVLDARLNESWNHASSEQREGGQYTRDQFMTDLQRAAGGLAPRGRHVHLYLAGEYWGLYNLHERPDQHFAATYRGGDADDWEVVKHRPDDVVNGDGSAYRALLALVDSPNVASEAGWADIEAVLDTQDFARYVLVNYWAGNTDWSHQNWYASYRAGDPGGRWRFHSWDSEHTLKDPAENVTGKDDAGGPTHIHRRLMGNPAYRSRFADAVEDLTAAGGPLAPRTAAALYRLRLAEIDGAIRAESARWGDNRRRRPYTRGDDWLQESDRLLGRYFPRRTATVLEQFRASGWLP